jgi:hypothetical protein
MVGFVTQASLYWQLGRPTRTSSLGHEERHLRHKANVLMAPAAR